MIALVTGGAIRVGRAITLALADAGYRVAFTWHGSDVAAHELFAALRARDAHVGDDANAFRADLTTDAGLDHIAATLATKTPCLDLLIHSAALFSRKPFQDANRDEFDRFYRLNVRAPYFLTQACLPLLLASPRDPSIVMVSDLIGTRAFRNFSHYGWTKAALNHHTHALALELAPRVRVNSVTIATVMPPEHALPEERDRVRTRIPLQRFGTPDDVTRAIVTLATSRFMTGQTLTIDGGRNLH